MQLTPSEFEVKPAEESIEFWLKQPYLSAADRQDIERANLLILPWYPDMWDGGLLFVRGSKEFLYYCQGLNEDRLNVKLCIGNAVYSQLELCSYDVFLPDVIVDRIIIPIYVKVMSGIISERITARFGNDIRVNAKVTIVDKDRNIATKFSYRGKPADYENTVEKTLKLIESASDLSLAGETENLSVEERIERLSESKKS